MRVCLRYAENVPEGTKGEMNLIKKIMMILTVACLLLTAVSCAFAETAVTVNGMGNIYMAADKAVITLGVQKEDTDVSRAQTGVNEAIASVLKALLEAGVPEEEISTDNINLYTYTDYTDDGEPFTRCNAGSTLSVRTSDLDSAGRIIDAAFAAGANTLNGVQFLASDTSEEEKAALEAAVKDAGQKAEILCAAAGLRLTGIVSVNESYTSNYDSGSNSIYAAKDAVMAEGASAGTLVQAARLCVSAQISVTYTAEPIEK